VKRGRSVAMPRPGASQQPRLTRAVEGEDIDSVSAKTMPVRLLVDPAVEVRKCQWPAVEVALPDGTTHVT
jgi:hypothetical protein